MDKELLIQFIRALSTNNNPGQYSRLIDQYCNTKDFSNMAEVLDEIRKYGVIRYNRGQQVAFSRVIEEIQNRLID